MKRHCIKCGSPAITDTSLYCNKCGSRLPTEKSCLQCGRKFSDDESRFCDKCGSSLALTVSSGIQEPKNSICQACGYENNEANRFHCKNCGAPLRRRVFGSEYRNNRLTGRALRLIPENSGAHRELPEPAPEDLIPLKAHHALQSGNKLKPYQRAAFGFAIIVLIILTVMLSYTLMPQKPGAENPILAFFGNLTQPIAAVFNASTVQSSDLSALQNPVAVVTIPGSTGGPGIPGNYAIPTGVIPQQEPVPVTVTPEFIPDQVPLSNIGSPVPDPALVI